MEHDPSQVHLIVCGLPSELVVTAARGAGLGWYLEPVAEDLHQLAWFLSTDPPLIRGGRHNVVVFTEHAGPPADLAHWLAALAGAPAHELTLVLLRNEPQPNEPPLPAAVLAAHPELHPATTTLPPGRILVAVPVSHGHAASTWITALVAALPAGLAVGRATPIDEAQAQVWRYPLTLTRAPDPVDSDSGLGAHVVVVLSARDGVGTTSIALAVATYVAAQHRAEPPPRVCVADFDLREPTLSTLTMAAESSTQDSGALAGRVQRLAAVPLDVFTPANPPAPARTSATVDIGSILRVLCHSYDIVLIDTHAVDEDSHERLRPLIEAASQILLVTDPTRTSVRALDSLLTTLGAPEGHALPLRYLGLVWNRIYPGLVPPVEDLRHHKDLRHLQYLPDTGVHHTRAVNRGTYLRLLWDCPEWAARVHLLTEALFGPDRVTPITKAVARLLPHLHRDGRPRTAYRLRRTLVGRYRLQRDA
ncbi:MULTISPECIES: hypothetical protein [unclassified Crossiella]|uniref:hypothetical protein n=1 Tax=unclassified Crossiella TaxID=2620835 RepID=UPI001FFEE7A3|nr:MULTISPECIES: hypothetical protein [unclassified Crossiella]MCK2240904.1 hypothetical protein [Crossiella sp. S99.2]MCK2253952.1 hypothetical protein [Crossiella sp. S99.1]